MLSIHNISIIMWILYIDKQQYWKCDWTINSGENAHGKRTVSVNGPKWQTSVDSWVTSERHELVFKAHTQFYVAWFDHRLFHSATISQCDYFCCYMHFFLTWHYQDEEFFFVCVSVWGLISSVSDIWCRILICRQSMVFWRLPPLLFNFVGGLSKTVSHSSR